VETGALADMRHLSRTTVDVTLGEAPSPTLLDGVQGVGDLAVVGSRLAFTVDTATVGEVLSRLQPYRIQSLSCQPPTLEQLFLKEYAAAPEPAAVGA
jgi:ABC-2 type transport system ATP-binding protein